MILFLLRIVWLVDNVLKMLSVLCIVNLFMLNVVVLVGVVNKIERLLGLLDNVVNNLFVL